MGSNFSWSRPGASTNTPLATPWCALCVLSQWRGDSDTKCRGRDRPSSARFDTGSRTSQPVPQMRVGRGRRSHEASRGDDLAFVPPTASRVRAFYTREHLAGKICQIRVSDKPGLSSKTVRIAACQPCRAFSFAFLVPEPHFLFRRASRARASRLSRSVLAPSPRYITSDARSFALLPYPDRNPCELMHRTPLPARSVLHAAI